MDTIKEKRINKQGGSRQVTGTSVVITPSLLSKIKNTSTKNWIYVSPTDHHMWSVSKNTAGRAIAVYKNKTSALNFAKKSVSPGFPIIIYDALGEVSNVIRR